MNCNKIVYHVIAVLESSVRGWSEGENKTSATGFTAYAPSKLQFSMSTIFQHIYRGKKKKTKTSLFFSIDFSIRFEEKGGQSKGQKNNPSDDCNYRGKQKRYYATNKKNITGKKKTNSCVRYVEPSPVLTDIFWAIILPPITASPVHKQCPSVPPTATPKGSWEMWRNKGDLTSIWKQTAHRCREKLLSPHTKDCLCA